VPAADRVNVRESLFAKAFNRLLQQNRIQSGRAKAEFQLLPLQHTQATLICLKAGIWRLFPRE